MKNLILDTPFRDSFSDFLEKGETIVWEGQPISINDFGKDDSSDDFEYHRLVTVLFWGTGIYFYWADISLWTLISFFIIFIVAIILPKWNRKNNQNFSYAITQNQILFQFKKKWSNKKILHAIPFSEIKDIIIVMTYDVERIKAEYRDAYEAIPEVYTKSGLEKIGTIFIVPHHPESINFGTTDLINNENRHLPTLELLDDVSEVGEYIKLGIENKL